MNQYGYLDQDELKALNERRLKSLRERRVMTPDEVEEQFRRTTQKAAPERSSGSPTSEG